MLFVSCCQLVGVHQCGGEGQTLLLRLLVHRAALLGFPPHRVGLMLTARGAHLYSHGLCSGKVEAFDVPLPNPGAGSEPPLQHFLMA
jgi:hypothetical protein